jgi:hypothetical protein
MGKKMKIIITESQYNRILKEEEEQKVLHIPSLKFFNDDWNLLQKFLESKGNPPYSIGGDLDLEKTPIKSLGNLTSVGGYLDLEKTPIESLGDLQSVGGDLYARETPIESLGDLQSVGGDLNLRYTPIKSLGNLTSVGGDLILWDTPIKSLGNLTSVGGDLILWDTPLSKKYTKKDIRQMVYVGGKLFM